MAQFFGVAWLNFLALRPVLWHHGQSLADVSIGPTCYVARADKKHVIVILNGEGDDELVGRYNQPLMIRDAGRRSGKGSGDADT